MNAHPVLLQKKYSRMINLFAEQTGITLDEALCFFYHSLTYKLMSKGISDMHFMSDDYLAEDLRFEYHNRNK